MGRKLPGLRTATAISRAKDLFPKARDNQILRRHVMKLAYWPTGLHDGDVDGSDLDWDWITTLEKKRIGELRIDETIGGFNNLRVIFFKANTCLANKTMNRIWILTVFQKKSQGVRQGQIKSFDGARTIIVERHNGGTSPPKPSHRHPSSNMENSRINPRRFFEERRDPGGNFPFISHVVYTASCHR